MENLLNFPKSFITSPHSDDESMKKFRDSCEFLKYLDLGNGFLNRSYKIPARLALRKSKKDKNKQNALDNVARNYPSLFVNYKNEDFWNKIPDYACPDKEEAKRCLELTGYYHSHDRDNNQFKIFQIPGDVRTTLYTRFKYPRHRCIGVKSRKTGFCLVIRIKK